VWSERASPRPWSVTRLRRDGVWLRQDVGPRRGLARRPPVCSHHYHYPLPLSLLPFCALTFRRGCWGCYTGPACSVDGSSFPNYARLCFAYYNEEGQLAWARLSVELLSRLTAIFSRLSRFPSVIFSRTSTCAQSSRLAFDASPRCISTMRASRDIEVIAA